MQIAKPNPPGWKPSTPPIAVEELRTVAETNRVLVVHCWAIRDGYDRTVDRIIGEVRPEFEGEVVFRSLDVDALSYRGNLYAWGMVLNVPTLLCFVNGQFEQRIVGVRPAKTLRKLLQELVNGA